MIPNSAATLHRFIIAVVLSLCLAGPVSVSSAIAQEHTPANSNQETLKREESQRMLGVVPRFGVTDRHNAPPLTPSQKFHLFAKETVDPFTFFSSGFQAGISQATNEFAGYGQGAAGYGKRYGATFADQASSGFFSNFFWPALLKQDPRYFRSGVGTTKTRIAYALSRVLIARNDNGKNSFNFSNVLGAFSSGGLSNVYYPKDDRGLGLTVSRSAISLAYGGAGALVDEFWPDIQNKLSRKKSRKP